MFAALHFLSCCLVRFPQIRHGAFHAESADERQAGRRVVIAATTVPTAAAATFVTDQSQQLRIRYLHQMKPPVAPSDGEYSLVIVSLHLTTTRSSDHTHQHILRCKHRDSVSTSHGGIFDAHKIFFNVCDSRAAQSRAKRPHLATSVEIQRSPLCPAIRPRRVTLARMHRTSLRAVECFFC